MTDTLIQRLRERRMLIISGDRFRVSDHPDPDCDEAADALEQQAAEIEQHCRNNAQLGAEVLRQAAEIAALRADAERWKALFESCVDDLGIYPSAFISANGVRVERTERQEGWNECVEAVNASFDAALRQEQQAKGDGA